jgi:hypothetical protein
VQIKRIQSLYLYIYSKFNVIFSLSVMQFHLIFPRFAQLSLYYLVWVKRIPQPYGPCDSWGSLEAESSLAALIVYESARLTSGQFKSLQDKSSLGNWQLCSTRTACKIDLDLRAAWQLISRKQRFDIASLTSPQLTNLTSCTYTVQCTPA